MESSVKMLPVGGTEASAKNAEKFAKFEEYRQRREKEKQERLSRIELRKKELRDHRLKGIQKSLADLQIKPNSDNVKKLASASEKTKVPASDLPSAKIAYVKSCVTSSSRGMVQRILAQPGSAAKKISTINKGTKRTTITSQYLTSTTKKPASRNLRPNHLNMNNENISRTHDGLQTEKKATKRQLLTSSRGSLKKRCLEVRNFNVNRQNVMAKVDVKVENMDDLAKNIPLKPEIDNARINDDKNANFLSSTRVLQEAKTEKEKKLTRQQELELWRQRKLLQTADPKGKALCMQSRRATLPATKAAMNVPPSAAKNSTARKTTPWAQTGVPKAKPLSVRSKINSFQAKRLPSTQKTLNQQKTKVAEGNRDLAATEDTQMAKELKTPHGTSVQLSKTVFLETIVSEPCTPEAKGPRMSTPYSNKCLTSPDGALALSSIVGNKAKPFTASWTPKTRKTPQADLSGRLEQWLAAHGKTPSRFRHLSCFGVHAREVSTPLPTSKHHVQNLNCTFQTAAVQVGNDGMEAVEAQLLEMFPEVTSLVYQGLPAGLLENWLLHFEKILNVKEKAYYWSLKALIAAASGMGGNAEALQILEEGERNKAEPSTELEKARSYINRDMNKPQPNSNATYSACKRLANEVQPENVFESSSVKFCMKRLPSLQGGLSTPQKVVVTPVRRSTRKSCGLLPIGLRDHDVIIESVDEIPPETRRSAFLQSNVALNLQWRFAEPHATHE